MTLELRRPNPVSELGPSVQFGGGSSDASTAVDSRNIVVTSGIHRGRFPIGGLRVREARAVLASLMNIDPSAVAVINGRAVGEDEIISENITMVAFVKPSAIKG
ncbi:MAG: hypothetical protein HUU20_18940 [Pirellulales bacterium]|nr:hypothetical protein [Pirellulales bacterium]